MTEIVSNDNEEIISVVSACVNRLINYVENGFIETTKTFTINDGAITAEVIDRCRKLITDLSNDTKNKKDRKTDEPVTPSNMTLQECVNFLINTLEKINNNGKFLSIYNCHDIAVSRNTINKWLNN